MDTNTYRNARRHNYVLDYSPGREADLHFIIAASRVVDGPLSSNSEESDKDHGFVYYPAKKEVQIMVSRRAKDAVTIGFGTEKSGRGKYRITKSEIKRRSGYIFLGIFVANLIDPIQNLIYSVGLDPIIVSLIGLVGVFYFFEF